MSFNEDMNRACVNIGKTSESRIKKLALAVYREINKTSPVDKGTFRANWVASIDTIDRSSDLSKTTKDVNEAVTAATAVITNGAKLGTTVFISNGVPYAGKLEDGYSPQAPAGVVGLVRFLTHRCVSSVLPKWKSAMFGGSVAVSLRD